jgi:AAA ATPase domain
MSTTTPFLSSQISIYNPGRLSDEEIERIFITRRGMFQYLFDLLVAERPGSIPQHHLVIGERGMGKSTLLHRLAAEFRKQPHREAFLPLTFPEDQYNIDRLSKFWLNCLDALADALDRKGEQAPLAELDADIDRWQKQGKHIGAMEMYGHFEDWSKRLGRRVVLLVDNLNLIFNKISREEQHQLRAILMKNGAPILVGASAHSIEDVVDYGAPFYDAFKIQTLKKLSFDEVLETLKNLAEITNNTPFINELYAHRGRLRALYQLTGGTPRTLTMLYPLIREGFSISIQTDLEALMDMATSLYKSRFEELPDQMQVVLDAIAMHWDPAHLEALREITHLENAQLSPQIKRLYDTGWINRLDAYKAKGNAYEISERFFNIWYLMRRSNRRKTKELVCFTKFLEMMYGEELLNVARKMIGADLSTPDHAGLQLAMADAVKDRHLAKQLRENSYKALLGFAKNDPKILNNFDISKIEMDIRDNNLVSDFESGYSVKKYSPKVKYSDFLNDAILAFQEKNIGIASGELAKALNNSEVLHSHDDMNDWYRFAAVAHKLGYSHEVLQTLEKTGYDIQLRPYYVAIKALGEKDSKAFLNSIAVEVREPAAMIMEKIKRYL